MSNPQACGGCPGTVPVCSSTQYCRLDTCLPCPAGQSRCADKWYCTDTLTSDQFCGNCSIHCNTTAGKHCVNGLCQ